MSTDKMKWREREDQEERSFRIRVGGREVTEVGCWADSLRNNSLFYLLLNVKPGLQLTQP